MIDIRVRVREAQSGYFLIKETEYTLRRNLT